MNLQPINPPLRPGQTVQCSTCGRMTSDAVADLDGPPFTFYCVVCQMYGRDRASDYPEERQMITITIKTDNAAFGDNRRGEIARILHRLAEEVERGDYMRSPRDINGNHVGNIIATGKDRGLA